MKMPNANNIWSIENCDHNKILILIAQQMKTDEWLTCSRCIIIVLNDINCIICVGQRDAVYNALESTERESRRRWSVSWCHDFLCLSPPRFENDWWWQWEKHTDTHAHRRFVYNAQILNDIYKPIIVELILYPSINMEFGYDKRNGFDCKRRLSLSLSQR